MKKLTLIFALITNASVFAAGTKVQCYATTPNGPALVFTVQDLSDAHFGHNDSLFGGISEAGLVDVRAVNPLKMEFTHFPVTSYPSMRYRINIGAEKANGDTLFSLQANKITDGRFTAKIVYRHPEIRYDAICEVH